MLTVRRFHNVGEEEVREPLVRSLISVVVDVVDPVYVSSYCYVCPDNDWPGHVLVRL
jgi:hypothetical protein